MTTPGRAIRQHCIDCVGGASDMRDCRGDRLYAGPCLFYPYRMGRGRPSLRLIRRNCLECMGGSQALVRECHSKRCPFLSFRMGRNPNITDSRGLRFKSLKWAAHGAVCPQESTTGAFWPS